MKILSIESSADDTAIALLEARDGRSFKIIAHEKASQAKLHEKYGGIYPNLAKNEHLKNLPRLLKKTLQKASLGGSVAKSKRPNRQVRQVDLITVTSGPGLEPCLWAGITFAEDLAKKWRVPLVPVNHMEGHILSVFGKNKGKFSIHKVKFPALALLVSGGHTELVLVKSWGKYKILGRTLDDAVGEAFDKVARMLGLPYPGGPEISRLTGEVKNSRFRLPRPMMKSGDFNFSYSGLKTAVYYLLKKLGKLNQKTKREIAYEFERAAIEPLVYKTKKALQRYKARALIVAGGVAANTHLRREMSTIGGSLPAGFGRRGASGGKKIKLLFPTPDLATDNAIMIGMAGYLNYLKNQKRKYKIRANGGLQLGEMIK